MATRRCGNPQPHAKHHTGREEWGQAGHGGFMDDIWCPGVMSKAQQAAEDQYPALSRSEMPRRSNAQNLVDEWERVVSAEGLRRADALIRVVGAGGRLCDALEAVQPVTPHREALIEFFHDRYSESGGCVHGATLRVCVGWADALLASGVLGQPQPQPDRAEAVRLIRGVLHPDATRNFQLANDYAHRIFDALLPLLGQPQTDTPLDRAYRGNRSEDTCWVKMGDDICRRPSEDHRTDAPRKAATVEELDALPDGSIVMGGTVPWKAWTAAEQYGGNRRWSAAMPDGTVRSVESARLFLPARILFTPEQDQARYPRTDTTEPGVA